MSTLDFFASTEAQRAASSFKDDRFNRPVQMLKFAPDTKGQRLDILPMSETRTHGMIKHHRLANSIVLCPTMFGKSCPLCDAIRLNNADKWYWNTFKPQDRALFNAVPVNKEGRPILMDPEHKVPIYLYEVGAPQKKATGFWKLLIGALGSTDVEDAYKKQFCSWDNGSTLKISFNKENFDGKDYADPSNLDFVHPRHDYSKEREKYEPHLYKIPDMYKEPNADELAQHFEMTLRFRAASANSGTNSGGYSSNLAEPSSGFFATAHTASAAPISGTAAWAAAQDDGDTQF